jgi:hypothetical protein
MIEEFTDSVVERFKGKDWDRAMELAAELLCLLEGMLAARGELPAFSEDEETPWREYSGTAST